jgi:uncharacterized protein (TIRG00374 family)
MTTRQKRFLYIVIGFAISAFLLWELFRNINFRQLVGILAEANYYWLIPNVLLVILAMYLRAYRWRFMIAPVKHVAYSKLLAATFIGFMANNVLPLRLGEFVRAYSLSYQDRDVSKSAALANIFVERMVFDLVALLMIFGAVVAASHLPVGSDIREGVTIAVAIALLGLAFMLFLALRPALAGNLIVKYLFFLPDVLKEKIKDIVIRFSQGLEFLTDLRMLTWVSSQTIILWLIMGISNYFVFLAFGFHLPITASYVLLVVVSISILIPSSPGFIGVYHAGAVWTLTLYGIGKEDALSFALVLHAAQFIPITLIGFYYLKKEHLSLKKLEEEAVESSS